jgi:hypothetical protein
MVKNSLTSWNPARGGSGADDQLRQALTNLTASGLANPSDPVTGTSAIFAAATTLYSF